MANKKKNLYVITLNARDFSGNLVQKLRESRSRELAIQFRDKWLNDTTLKKRSVDVYEVVHIFRHTKGRMKKCDG